VSPLCLVPEASAHRSGLSYAQIQSDALILTFARPELARLGPVDDLGAASARIAEATLARAKVTSSRICVVGEPAVRAVEGDGIEIRAGLACPSGESWNFEAGYLAELQPGHRAYLEAFGAPVAVLDRSQPTATFAGAADRGQVALEFGKLGVEHIASGYDHLAFLAGLLLAAPRLRDVLFIVTGFTVAHSITLSLAATGAFTLPPSFVEPAIAASIAWVGIENFWDPGARRRVAITFGLGLIHGFGFAGALAELGLPRGSLALALVTFNAGVEAGQAAVVGVLLPVLLLLARTSRWRTIQRVLSAAVAVAGAAWLWGRV
jgi:hypothetical protein